MRYCHFPPARNSRRRAPTGVLSFLPSRPRSLRAVTEIAEEFAVRRQDDRRGFAWQGLLIGQHRAIEGEEVWILAISIAQEASFLGITLAAHDLSLARGLGYDHGDLALSARP